VTLSIAARFPWGRMTQVQAALAGAGARLDSAVLLATDSRFTVQGKSVLDQGQKLYIIGSDAALVFASDVLAAERGITGIRTHVAKRGRLGDDPVQTTRELGQILRRAYEREQERSMGKHRERGAMHPLHVLLGYCAGPGVSGIVRYSSNARFEPIHLPGIQAVGPKRAVEYFRQVMPTRPTR
jgi:hypothetical protein